MAIYIADRWIPYLDMLPQKDYCILIKAILHGEEEPTISDRFQYIAHQIYGDIKKLTRAKEGMKKTRSNRNSYSNGYSNGYDNSYDNGYSNGYDNSYSNGYDNSYGNGYSNSYATVTQEEKREVSPLSPPLSFPPHPLSTPPYNPPSPEKREESLSDAHARALDSTDKRSESLESRFEELWKQYPKKVGKSASFADYKRAVKDGTTDEEIADGIQRYLENIRVRGTTPQYILNGSTYFHQRRWTDEYDNTAPAYQQTERSVDVFMDVLNEQLEVERQKREWV